MEKNSMEVFIGRLGKDPKLSYTRHQEPICTFSIAVENQDAKETEWRRVVVFKRQAELCSVHLRKGQMVLVQGQKVRRTFTNNEGQKLEIDEFRAVTIGLTNL